MNGWEAITHITDQIGQGFNTAVEGLTGILQSVGQLVHHLYLVLVRQQVILGIQELLWGLLWWTGTALLLVVIRHINKKRTWVQLDKYVAMAILCILVWITITNGAEHVIGSLPRLLNPEYYAIQDGIRIYGEVKR